MSTIYCVDSSGWLDGWQRHYPKDVFPSLWLRLEEAIQSGRIKCCEEVYIELQRKDDDLHHWIMSKKHMLVPLDEPIQETSSALLQEYPRLVDTLRGRSQADPFVIATAIRLGAVVVTGEVRTGNMGKPRIPDVCDAKKLPCLSFLAMIRDLRLSF
jgi:hypothetical protein